MTALNLQPCKSSISTTPSSSTPKRSPLQLLKGAVPQVTDVHNPSPDLEAHNSLSTTVNNEENNETDIVEKSLQEANTEDTPLKKTESNVNQPQDNTRSTPDIKTFSLINDEPPHTNYSSDSQILDVPNNLYDDINSSASQQAANMTSGSIDDDDGYAQLSCLATFDLSISPDVLPSHSVLRLQTKLQDTNLNNYVQCSSHAPNALSHSPPAEDINHIEIHKASVEQSSSPPPEVSASLKTRNFSLEHVKVSLSIQKDCETQSCSLLPT